MTIHDSLTEIGQRMTSAKTDPVTVADVIAVINKGFALEMKNFSGSTEGRAPGRPDQQGGCPPVTKRGGESASGYQGPSTENLLQQARVPVEPSVHADISPEIITGATGGEAQEGTRNSRTPLSVNPDSCGLLQTPLSRTQVLHLLQLGLDKDILRAAAHGLETSVPDYTEE